MATATKTIFKSSTSEKRWLDLQKEKVELQSKKLNPDIQDKIDVIVSLMTACKVGFNLSEAKVKKITKFLKKKTGKNKIKYGTIPSELSPNSELFKEVVFWYVEKDGQVFFKEHG